MRYLTLLAFCCTFFFALAQINSTFPDLPATDFQAMDIDGDRMVTVGTCEQLWYSEDLGETWRIYTTGEASANHVFFHPTEPDQALYLTSNTLVFFDVVQGQILSTHAVDAGFIREVRLEGSTVFALVDSDVQTFDLTSPSWTTYFELGAVAGNTLAISPGFVTVGTFTGEIVRINRQSLEHEVTTIGNGRISDLEVLDDNYGIFRSDNVVRLTEDGFQTIRETNFTIARNLHLPGRDTIISILGFSLTYSTDGGQTEQSSRMSNTARFGNVEDGLIMQDGSIHVYGQGATVAYTRDFGENWQFPSSAYQRTDLFDVALTSTGNVYACGEFGRLLYSEDEGRTWSDLTNTELANEGLLQMAVLGESDLLLRAGSGDLIRWLDGEVVNIMETDARVLFQGRNNDFLLLQQAQTNGGAQQILRSTDGGMNWEEVLEAEQLPFNIQIFQSEDGKLYFADNNGNIYVSTDQGVSWQSIATDRNIRLVYQHADVLYIISNQGELFRSDDDGMTWVSLYRSYLLGNAVFGEADEIYLTFASNDQTNLIHTTDGGESWEVVYKNCSPTRDMLRTPDGELLMVQNAGHINRFERITTSNDELELGMLRGPLVFPNPVAQGQQITLAPAVERVRVFDIQGRLLWSGQGGRLDSRHLPIAGMYFLHLQTSFGTQVEKVIMQ